jgi:hypothetical protein
VVVDLYSNESGGPLHIGLLVILVLVVGGIYIGILVQRWLDYAFVILAGEDIDDAQRSIWL